MDGEIFIKIGLFTIASFLVITNQNLQKVKLLLLISLLNFFYGFLHCLMASFLYCFPHSFTPFKAIAKGKEMLIAPVCS